MHGLDVRMNCNFFSLFFFFFFCIAWSAPDQSARDVVICGEVLSAIHCGLDAVLELQQTQDSLHVVQSENGSQCGFVFSRAWDPVTSVFGKT